MRIDMLKNAFLPDGSKSPTILKKGSIQDVSDEHGSTLIEKGYAVEQTPPKPAKSQTPDETWTVEELKAFAADKNIDLTTAKKKPEIIAAIAAATPTA